tara:strand:- start:50446 stop:54405 length:3960 start_codon:yes stop_codon:yes gene_type:complete
VSAEFVQVRQLEYSSKKVKLFIDYDESLYFIEIEKNSLFSKNKKSRNFDFQSLDDYFASKEEVNDFLNKNSIKKKSFQELMFQEFESYLLIGKSPKTQKIYALRDNSIIVNSRSWVQPKVKVHESIIFSVKGKQWKIGFLTNNNMVTALSIINTEENLDAHDIVISGNKLNVNLEDDNHFSITIEKLEVGFNVAVGISGQLRSVMNLPYNYSVKMKDNSLFIKKLFLSLRTNMEKEDGVQLLSSDAEHEKIVKIPETNYYFKDFDNAKFEKIKIDNISTTVESLNYRHCMIYSILYGYEYGLDTDEDVYEQMCYKYALFSTMPENSQKNEAVSCLVEGQILFQVKDSLFWSNYNLINKDSSSLMSSCLAQVNYTNVKSQVGEQVRNDFLKNDRIKPETLKLIVDTEVDEWSKKCDEKTYKSETCQKRLRNLSEIISTKVYLTNLFNESWSGNFLSKERILKEFNQCTQDVKEKNIGNFTCFKTALLSYASVINEETINPLFISLGIDKRWSGLSEELQKKVKSEINDCIEYQILDFEDSKALSDEFSSVVTSCRLSGVKIVAVSEYADIFLKKLERLVNFLDDVKLQEFSKLLERSLGKKLNGDLTLNFMKKAIAAHDVEAYALFFTKILSSELDLKFSLAVEDSEYNIIAREEIEKAILRAIFVNNGYSFQRNISNYLQSFYDKEGERGLVISFKDLVLKSFNIIRPFETVSEVGKFAIGETRNNLAATVDSDYKKCTNNIAPNSKADLFDSINRCNKLWYKSLVSLKYQRKLTNEVSYHFRLSSNKANLILSPLTYLNYCFDDIDKSNSLSYEDYTKKGNACVRILQWDISYNISAAKVEGFKPILDSNGYDIAVTNYCYNNMFLKINRDAEDSPLRAALDDSNGSRSLIKMQTELRSRSSYKGSILANIRTGFNWDFTNRQNDKRNMLLLIDAISSSPNLNEEYFVENLTSCQKEVDDFIITGFRNYLVNSIPGLTFDEDNYKLMSEFFDSELLELFIKFQKLNENFSLGGLGGSLVPNERVITPELGLTALKNFIHVMGEYISKGFVFDKPAMKTELVVFQGELKDFLTWYLANPRDVKISESREFFQESKLADHLAMAVVSEMVKDQFDDFLASMKTEELESFYKRIDCRYLNCMSSTEKKENSGIKNKFILLARLSSNMTKSYDFRRIVRPKSQEGEKYVNYIKDNFLLVKILGMSPTNTVITEIKKSAGKFIINDETDGGFAEQFVGEVAQQLLDVQENDKWGITKFFFYDSGDFNWRRLRKTKSGRKAIQYYGQNILLPKIFSQRQTQYSLNLYEKEFRKLLKRAQSENDY